MSSLGETLAEERRRRGKTIVDVEAATRIRGRLLEALENGRYDELPSSAYVKGYIQSYAQFLELPVRPLLDQYAAERRLTPEANLDEHGLIDLPADAVVPKREHAHEMPMRTWATIVIVLAVGGLLLWGLVSLVLRPKSPSVPAAPLTADEAAKPKPKKPKASSKPKTTPGSEATKTAGSTEPTSGSDTKAGSESSAKPFTLRLAVADGEASWLKVTVDGLTAYEGTLEGGVPKEWRVTSDAKLRIGRPSAVTVTRDGETVEIQDSGNIGLVELSASDNQ